MTGTEGIWIVAAKNLASLAIKTGWDLGTKELPTTLKQQVFRASQGYIQKYKARHGTLQVLGMSKPIDLESIYTTVQLLDATSIHRFETVEALEIGYRQTSIRKLGDNNSKRTLGLAVANQERFLTVIGGPGVGKSTFLRKVGLEAIKGKSKAFSHHCIPVFLELKRFDSDIIDVEEMIIEEFRTCGFPDPEAFTKKALDKGRLLVLLDGIDEVPSKNLTQVVQKIQDFIDKHKSNIDKYKSNRFIVSCRIAAYHGYLKGCINVEIAEFDESQISQFINNWFQSDIDRRKGTAATYWNLLQKPENASALELAQTPLLLTFLCLVFDRSQNLPPNRSTLYQKALNILLEEWAAEKRIRKEVIYEGMHTGIEKALLSEIAYIRFESNQLFFSKQTVIDQIATFLAEMLEAPKNLDSAAVLNAIESQQGILVERAEDIYSFSHLTIQEFLAARYIAEDQKLLEKVIYNHLADERWQEVFLLIAGLKDSANDLLIEIEKRCITYISSKHLKSLMAELEQVGGNLSYSEASVHDSACARVLSIKRVLSKASALSDFGQSTIFSRAHDRARVLSKEFPTNASVRMVSLSSVQALEEQDIISLSDYLQGIVVMVQCKRSANRVIQRSWSEIERRILSPRIPKA